MNFIFTSIISIALTLLVTFTAFAQNGIYDLQFKMNDVDCATNKTYIDIEVRANNAATHFNLSDQNYRFSFNRAAIVPSSAVIHEEKLIGFVAPSSFYDPHTLTGSLDTIVSYNVTLAGGSGVLITTAWTTIGTISFDIADATECLNLKWHDHNPENFPPTFIGEKIGNALYPANEGLYLNTSVCPLPICGESLPIELTSFNGADQNCTTLLEWTTGTETNNEFFQIEKSLDGNEYQVIGKVNGSGTTLLAQSYRFVDITPSPVAYYRLKQVDFDGTTVITKIIAVKSACYHRENADMVTDIFPNPVTTGDVKVKFFSAEAQPNATLLVTDMLGRVVFEQLVSMIEGENTLSFSTIELSAGTYAIKISTDTYSSKAHKFVKLRE